MSRNALSLSLCLLAGCTLFPSSSSDGEQLVDASAIDAPPRCWWPPTDFLFVIENSALIAPYENKLEQTFRDDWPDLLGTLQGGFPKDTRFGVATSDVECDGAGTYSELNWRGIVSYHDRPDVNAGETLAGFANVGHDGCGVNRPIEAARRAVLDPRFRRADARLSIVFISANADQSTIAPSVFADAAKSTTDPVQVGVAVIAKRDARWEATLDEFPNRSSFVSIDTTSWTDGISLWACLF